MRELARQTRRRLSRGGDRGSLRPGRSGQRDEGRAEPEQGSRLPRRPRHEAYVSASYLWCKRLRTTISAKWVNGREEQNFGGPNFDIEDYTLVNFAAEYEINPHISVFGRIDNLTNEHYAEVFGFPALGRAAYGGMKLSF